MARGDWLDIKFLQMLSRHSTSALAALVSYTIISRYLGWAIGPGWFRTYLEYIDKTILMVIFLYFLISLGYDLWKEIKTSVGGNSLVLA